MTEQESLFEEIGHAISGAEKSQMFGKPCFKTNGKAFACFFKDCMVFKLDNPYHQHALSLDGSVLFDPSGKGRPMKEWVQVSYEVNEEWKALAQAAFDYVTV